MSKAQERDLPPSTLGEQLVICSSLGAFFQDAVERAKENQGLEATDASAEYVAGLLETYSDADEMFGGEPGARTAPALADILADAIEEPTQQIRHYRRLGDLALVVAGLFSDSLKRRAVDLRYYVNMGQSAYGVLADIMTQTRSGADFGMLYEELADTFRRWVEVLREISEDFKLTSPLSKQPTAELIERLAHVGGTRRSEVGTALLHRGVLPSF